MAAEKTVAIVTRVVEFSETSCILTLFTEDFGKVRALAKGARRPKSPFESAIDLLAVCRIVFLRKSTDALDLLTEARLERRFRVARGGLGPLYAGYYVAELLDALTDDSDAQPELFRLADATLAALSAPRPCVVPRGRGVPGVAPAAVDPLVTARHIFHFELAALHLAGHLPSLEVCVECGDEVRPATRVAFGNLAGGVLCARCRPGHRAVTSVSQQGVQAMLRLSAADGWHDVELTPSLRGEIRGVLNQYIAHLLGKPPRLQKLVALG